MRDLEGSVEKSFLKDFEGLGRLEGILGGWRGIWRGWGSRRDLGNLECGGVGKVGGDLGGWRQTCWG